MTPRRRRRGLKAAVALACVAGALAVVRPWTVVPIQSTPVASFDPRAHVASIWDARVFETAEETAIDLRAFMDSQASGADLKVGASMGDGPRAVFVTGTATVADVDRTSRIGLARLRLPWTDDAGVAAIQIGPVLRGTALRDALEFIRFTDFVNQLEFAGVANALNDRVLADVIGPLNVDDLAGHEVTFLGAVPTTTTGGTLEIVPVRVRPVGGAR